MIVLKIIGVIISSLLLWASFPPSSQSDSAWLALVPLLLIIRYCKPKAAFQWVFISALLFWVFNLGWFPAIIKNGGPWYLVVLGQVALSAACAFLMALFAFASSSLWQMCDERSSLKRIALIVLVDPLLWVGTEYIRSWILSGFAWNFFGVSQVENIALIQVASVAGVYGVSALLVMVNGALASLVERAAAPLVRKVLRMEGQMYSKNLGVRLMVSAESFIPLTLVLICWLWGMNRIKNWDQIEKSQPAWRIALVQPNTPCIFINNDETMLAQLDLMQEQIKLASAARPHLIVMPETSIFGAVPYDSQTMRFVRECARLSGSALLTGTLEVEKTEKSAAASEGLLFYNAAWMFSAEGEVLGRYRKQHLVPFGEYIPLDKQLPILQKLAPTGISCTAGKDASLIELTDKEGRSIMVGSLICFEDTLPSLSRKSVQAGANILALMTNDAWFNGSIEPQQHLQQSVFRAVECGIPMVRAANSGVSCVVDVLGRVRELRSGDKNTDFHGFLLTQVYVPPQPLPAPYAKMGDWILAIPGMVALILVAGFAMLKKEN
ncbi:MAG: apolipoprotein N-acyltransferase [Kiritimatiellae bacterium]|jgi:apolipoprotein N-acyltransferase|nr:apolipoprotein N-acyltransferase [Kiritimatiellia bacterium]